MPEFTQTLGGLSCRIVDAVSLDKQPQLIVVLCHGFGAPGTDLVPLAAEILHRQPTLTERVRFVFPAAPLSLDEFGMSGARAWWWLDMNRITQAIESGEMRDLRNDLPKGLPESREMLVSLIHEVMEQTGLPSSRILLGGFSQGSMLATDVALHLPDPPAGLCIFSGTLLCEKVWQKLADHCRGLPVLQTHGRQDPLLPFPAAIWLKEMLEQTGLDVDFLPFDGMHTIPQEGLERLAEMIKRLAA